MDSVPVLVALQEARRTVQVLGVSSEFYGPLRSYLCYLWW